MTAETPASPACLAHEADDSYMGFASREEILRFLKALEAAPLPARAEMLRQMLPKIRDDVLHSELCARLEAIETNESAT